MSTFNRFLQEDIVVSTDKIVTNAWTNGVNKLETFFTSSNQNSYASSTSQANFFLEIYKDDINLTSSAEVQFTVSYGHRLGSGSVDFTNVGEAIGYSATRCIYNQYRQLVFGDEKSNFSFNNHTPRDIHVINVARSRYKHNLKPGTLNLKLIGNNTLHLTDDSITKTGSAVITNIGRQFNIVSGSDGTMSGSSLNQTPEGSGSYGLFYTDAGFIVLNAEALRNYDENYWLEGSSNVATAANRDQMYTALKAASSFELDSEEKISSQYFFTRIKNGEFNYTTNPSYVDTNGDLNISSFADSPTTYITTVGLYNDDNNLLAVAKLSQPLKKDFTTEALVRVKLDY